MYVQRDSAKQGGLMSYDRRVWRLMVVWHSPNQSCGVLQLVDIAGALALCVWMKIVSNVQGVCFVYRW